MQVLHASVSEAHEHETLTSLQLVVLRGTALGLFCGGKCFAVICAAWLFPVVGVVEPRFWRPSFSWYFAYYSGGKELNWAFICKGKIQEVTRHGWPWKSRTEPSSPRANSGWETCAVVKNLFTKNAECRLKLPLFFHIRTAPPSVLDRELSNLLPQSPNLPFQFLVVRVKYSTANGAWQWAVILTFIQGSLQTNLQNWFCKQLPYLVRLPAGVSM